MACASPPRSRYKIPRGREKAARCGECRSRIGAPFSRQSSRGTRNHQKPLKREESTMTKTIVRTRDIESQPETRLSLLELLREPGAEPKGTLTLARRNGGELLAPWTWPLSL